MSTNILTCNEIFDSIDDEDINKFGFIYKITNIINNKVYIGQTKTTVEHRFKEHKRFAVSENERAKNGI